MPRVQFFAIPAEDTARARSFYQQVFGWEFRLGWEYDSPAGRESFWAARTGPASEPGIDGGLVKREYSGQPISVAIGVPSADDYLSRIEAHGGRTIVPKSQLPDGSWFALCQDSEGNTFAIVEAARETGTPGA